MASLQAFQPSQPLQAEIPSESMTKEEKVALERLTREGRFKDVNKAIPPAVAVYLRVLHDHGNLHAHFNDQGKSSLSDKGEWANKKGFRLTDEVADFLQLNGWTIPKNNASWPEFEPSDESSKAYSEVEILEKTQGLPLPASMWKVEHAHNGAAQDHIHFWLIEVSGEEFTPSLNKDGTWCDAMPQGRSLTEEEETFITRLGWTIP
ncbi:MAG: hypothetical protein ACHQUC_03775 [Chlamydiales bacterium]